MNLNQFKIFMAVYETRSMTAAADQLHLTQSGVSQHIRALEDDIGQLLFSRVGRKLLPTQIADQVYPDIQQAFQKVTDRLAQVTGRDLEPEGLIRIGMPIEFGRNVLIPRLSDLGRRYPKLTFEITLDYVSVMNQMMAKGELDFAYIDEAPIDRRIQYQTVASENLLLCASREYVARQPRVKYAQSYFENLEYIEYKGSEPILRRWMLHHLKRKNLKLNVRTHIMDVQGVAKFITCGLGVGVLPDHLVRKMQDEGTDLYVYQGKGGLPLRNEIRLVRLKGQTFSRSVQTIFDELSAAPM